MNKKRVAEIFKGLKNRKIVVLGDIILDAYWWGDSSRISPEAPVPIVQIEKESVRPGGSANVAKNLKALGAYPRCVGVIGKDAHGATLKKAFSEEGIRTDFLVTDAARPTTLKTRIISRNQQVVRVDREEKGDISRGTETRVLAKFKKALSGASAVIISDYGKGVLTSRLLKQAIQLAKKKKIFLAIDPKDRDFSDYAGASIITPNQKETEEAVNFVLGDKKRVERAGKKLLKKCRLSSCLITLGPMGMALFEEKQPVTHIPTVARDVFDVSGAGDTVIGTLAASVSGGATLKEAALIANSAAGVVIREVGTAVASARAVKQAIFEKA